MGGISERGKEIKRRRKRREKITKWAKRLKKATTSETTTIKEKIRRMTPGAEVILGNLGVKEKK